MKTRRRWHHNYPEGWDSNFEDFAPTYGSEVSMETNFLIMAINGFSCGYPECCVFDFMRKWWKFAHTHDNEDIRSRCVGVTETGQFYAQCERHNP
ncbi:MAG TPA: hypothetical protein VEP90_05495 [Methylomirabilota bacterium]|nr:hypothetical protein [Methylomirabilota bacterium]